MPARSFTSVAKATTLIAVRRLCWLWSLALVGCPASTPRVRDAGPDAAVDAAAATDAGRDGGLDAGFDAGTDAGYDAGPSMCDLPTACMAGAIEETDDCGRCGVMTRTCNASCVWTDFACVEDPDRCDYWVHPDGATGWSGYRLGPSAFAPASPVRAAMPIDGTEEALVLTDTTIHRLRWTCEPGVTPCWVASAPIATWFPELAGATVRYANDIPAVYRGDGIEGIDLITDANDYRYEYEVATTTNTHVATNPAPASMAGALDRTRGRGSFSVLGNAAGWLAAPCGDPPTVPTDYIATIEATDVFIYAPAAGCGAYHRALYSSFGPFAEPGAPPIARVGAAFHRGGLFVLAE